MSAQQWVIIDTETDGLSSPIHVIEIAAQLMDGWEPSGEPFQIFLDHGVVIPDGAMAIHGYSQEFLRKNGRPPLEAYHAFRSYAKDYPIVAHNLGFDWNRALAPEWASLGLSPIGRRGLCTMLLSRRVIHELGNHSLEALKQHFCLGDTPSHKALSDVGTVVRLFKEVLRPRLHLAGIRTFEECEKFSKHTPISECRLMLDTKPQCKTPKTYYLGTNHRSNSFQANSKSEHQVEFIGQLFCFTGKFAYGTRQQCQIAVEQRGAYCSRRPTKSTSYLVVGSMGGGGSKADEAEQFRRQGSAVVTLAEEEWIAALKKTPLIAEARPILKKPKREKRKGVSAPADGGAILTLRVVNGVPDVQVGYLPSKSD